MDEMMSVDKPLRLGIISDRFLFDEQSADKLYIAHSFWDWCKRIISWIYSPASYSRENRKTVDCFQKYLVEQLGAERLKRICARYDLDLDQIKEKGGALFSHHVAKIVVGGQDVRLEDMLEVLKNPDLQPQHLKDRLASFTDPTQLDPLLFNELYTAMSNRLPAAWRIADVGECLGGQPTKFWAQFFFNRELADRERLHLCKENPTDRPVDFMHNMVARVIRREMEVGTLVRAPNGLGGKPQFYYLSGKLITGQGQVSYIFHPATPNTELEPIRFFRGSSFRSAEIDSCPTFITDTQKELGRSAFESGLPYEKILKELYRTVLSPVRTEAGHSLGATIAQYRLANFPHISKSWLFSGPGIPRGEMEKFNKMTEHKQLIIRKSTCDLCNYLGDYELGYHAGPNVEVDAQIYHTPLNSGKDPHITVWAKEKLRYGYGISANLTREHLNEVFDHSESILEKVRSVVGPVLSKTASLLCSVSRTLFGARALTERGLQIGSIENGQWIVRRYITPKP